MRRLSKYVYRGVVRIRIPKDLRRACPREICAPAIQLRRAFAATGSSHILSEVKSNVGQYVKTRLASANCTGKILCASGVTGGAKAMRAMAPVGFRDLARRTEEVAVS